MVRWQFKCLRTLGGAGLAGILAICASSGSAGALKKSEPHHYTIAYSVPLGKTDPQTKAAEQFAKQVETKTKGLIHVVVYTTDSLGTQSQIDQEVSSGTSQMVATAPGDISTLYPPLSVVTLPFLFASTKQVFAAENGKLGAKLSSGMEKTAGIRIMAWGALGWVQLLTKTKTITQLSTLHGVKVRTAGTPEEDGAFTAAGAVPVTLSFGTLYTGLETGTVGACALPVTVIKSGKYYEAAPNLTNLNFFYQNSVVFMNNKFYDSLPSKFQRIITEAAKKAALTERNNLRTNLKSELLFLKSNGVHVGQLSGAARSAWAKLSDTKVVKPFAKKYGELVKLAKDA